MKTTIKNSEAVQVDGNNVTLEVYYNIQGTYSDSISFFALIGGRDFTTKAEAIKFVIAAAKAWAASQRAQGHDIGVWDEAGNYY